MEEFLDDERFFSRLDMASQRLGEYSDKLSAALLSNIILSRDLIGLNSEIFQHDARVSQLNNDSKHAQEYLSKLEALGIRAQFFESQIDVLEAHARRKMHRGSHQRIPSVNDFKDEMLDWRTTETTLENLYHEFGHLKKQLVSLTHCSPQLTQDCAAITTPVQQGTDYFGGGASGASGARIVRHTPNVSSVSTTATSVFDDTTAHFRPLRCSSRKKRKSSLNTIASVLNDAPIAFNPEAEDSGLFDETVIRHSRSFHELLQDKYQGDLFGKKLQHFSSYQGLRIQYADNHDSQMVKHTGLNMDFKFPTRRQPTKMYSKSTQHESEKQTMHWLSKIAENDQSPKKRRASFNREAAAPSVTPLSYSTVLHTSSDISRTSQTLLLDMMTKQKQKEKLLEAASTQEPRNPKFALLALSKNISSLHISSPVASDQASLDKSVGSSVSGMNSETNAMASLSEASTFSDGTAQNNIHQEKKQWGLLFSKLLYSHATSDSDAKTPLTPTGPIGPVLENDLILTDELQHALDSDLLFN